MQKGPLMAQRANLDVSHRLRVHTREKRVRQSALAAISACLSVLAVSTPTFAQTADLTSAVAMTQRFHELLSKGDSAGAVLLLAPDLTVVESGTVETRAEYLAHHLGADMEFAKAVPGTRQVVSGV